VQNIFLKFKAVFLGNKPISSPLKTVDFIERELTKSQKGNKMTNSSLTEGAGKNILIFLPSTFPVCLNAYEFLITDLLTKTDERIKEKIRKSVDKFSARKQSEAFYGQTMAIAYGEVGKI
jgi:hypothetical protein